MTTPLTLQGGVFTIDGGGSTDTSVTVNSLTTLDGQSTINMTPLINQASTATLNIGSLALNNSFGTIVFNGYVGTLPGPATPSGAGAAYNVDTLGQVNLNNASQILISSINGNSISLVNNILGGWAVANGATFATYDSLAGVASLNDGIINSAGTPLPTFDGTSVTSTSTFSSWNIQDNTTHTLTVSKTINSLQVETTSADTLTLAAGVTLTLNAGLITNSANVSIVGASSTSALTVTPFATNPYSSINDPNSPMAGPLANLYVFVNAATTTLGVNLVGPMNLVKSGGATLTLAPLSGNTYTGATYVQQGTLTLSAPSAGIITVPGDLIANNAAINFGTLVQGQISSSSNITLNGASSLTLPNFTASASNIFSSLTYVNTGGASAPTFNLGSPTALDTVEFTAANAITAQNDNFAFVPTISSGAPSLTALIFLNSAPVITTYGAGDQISPGVYDTGAAPVTLQISAPIASSGGPITKAGTGALLLSGASTFTSGLILSSGTLIIGASSVSSSVGPLGSGALAIDAGTTILSSNNYTVDNTVNVNGSFTFGGTGAVNSLTLAGPVNLGGNPLTITVANPLVTGVIGGIATSTAAGTAFTKQGLGALKLANASNNFGGAGVTVAAGILQNGVANALPNASALTVNAGAEYDLNGFGQVSQQIAGGGVITDSGAAATLVVGGASATDTTTPNTVNSVFSGAITNAAGPLALTKSGLGSLTLSGIANTFGGATNVNAGALVVSGSISGSTTVNVGTTGAAASLAVASTGVVGSLSAPVHLLVGANGTLSGNGIINAAAITTNSGAIVAPAPGDFAGLTINNGSATLSTGSTLDIALANRNAGSSGAPAAADYSKLTLGSGVTTNISGADLSLAITGQVNVGDLFTIILNGGNTLIGTFANTTQISGSVYQFTSGIDTFEINYAFSGAETASHLNASTFASESGGANVAVLVMAVPEPNSWSMLLGSLGLSIGLQRFRRRRKMTR